ncbi:MAG: hypothetical protein IJ300_05950 [Clostridia bacterium]|nr:hypothetical protein [Clostridia bacterium]
MKRVEETIEEKLLYREPMFVREVLVFDDGNGYPICPRCCSTFEREYQEFCDRCGQHLKWYGFSTKAVRIKWKDCNK